jgi:asparagine synthase (glutamine-hydrolysing)
MRDTLVHRGPDGAGIFHEQYEDGGAVGLGHRRLSIVDLAHGAQPMASDDGALQLVYNGEVYNHPAQMQALAAEGVRYHTHCDTETVLRLYERHGVRAPERMRGMFAVAIWNRGTRELFLARDRFGVKPLYYVHTDDGALYFASEIKALLEAGAVSPTLNWRALPDFLANHAPSGDETLFAGVRRCRPGHSLTWRDGRSALRQYWDLSFAGEGTDRARARPRGRLRGALPRGGARAPHGRRAARHVPLRRHRLGGDHGAMSQLVDDQIKTFSVAFAEREANELRYARLVAERYRRTTTRSPSPPTSSSRRCRRSCGTRTSPSPTRRASRSTSCRGWRPSG